MAVLPRDAHPTKRSWRSPATAEAPAGMIRRLGIFPFPAIAGEPGEPAQSLKLVSRVATAKRLPFGSSGRGMAPALGSSCQEQMGGDLS
jgi:hypothetical protein